MRLLIYVYWCMDLLVLHYEETVYVGMVSS